MNFKELKKQNIVFSGLNYSEKTAKALIFGVPLEETVSGKKGTAKGINALRKASTMLETYSLNSGKEYFENCPTLDLGDLKIEKSLKKNLEKIEKVIKEILQKEKTPIMLGGEHTITLAALRVLKGKEFVLLHFDAHPDLRQELNGKELTHASFLRKALNEKVLKKEQIMMIGIRTGGMEEIKFLQKSEIKSFSAKELMEKEKFEKAKKEIENFTKNKECYISLDLDVLDAGLVPAVGTLEPGGLNFWQTIELLKSIKGKVIGFDLVETAPDPQMLTQTIAAKMLYEMLGILKFK